MAVACGYLRIVEHWGSGVLKTIAQCEDTGLGRPAFKEFGGSFCATLYRPAKKKTTEVATEESKEKSKEKILHELSGNPNLTAALLAEKTGLSRSGIEKILRELTASGAVRRVGGRKAGHWEVAE